ncbi:MAG: TRAP transporter small permease [Anderseniella sp.]|nr:TRAP transporter small permease [Anderseniella sp.]
MADNQSGDRLGRFLARADRIWSPLEDALNLFSGILIFALMLMGMVQIVLRVVWRNPIYGYIDIIEVGMIAFALFSISYVMREGGHVRMELLVSNLKGRALWIAELLGVAVAFVITAILIPYSWTYFHRAWSFGDSTIDIELSTWPAKLVVPVMLSVLLVRLLIQLAGFLRLSMNPDLPPVAVPVLKSVEQQAEEEIEGAR